MTIHVISLSTILQSKVLIVDDQEANVILLEQILLREGYQAITSTMKPRDVYELHKKNSYDLILLDLQMPEMDGFEVMEELKQIEKDGYLPVLGVLIPFNVELDANLSSKLIYFFPKLLPSSVGLN